MSRPKRSRDGSSLEEADEYATQWYWEERYQAGGLPNRTDEWLLPWRDLKPLLRSVKRDAAILDIGCGTSELCFELAEAYPEGRIVGMDNAPTAIETMKSQQRQLTDAADAQKRVEFDVVDALKLHLKYGLEEGGAFDVAIDKSTLDAIMCDE
jgi:SAM-dependent methyltransferase